METDNRYADLIGNALHLIGKDEKGREIYHDKRGKEFVIVGERLVSLPVPTLHETPCVKIGEENVELAIVV